MQVRALHPAHTAASVAAALPRLRYYEEGSCAVHHMFGAQVTERVRAAHGDALLTAHFEVRSRDHVASCPTGQVASWRHKAAAGA